MSSRFRSRSFLECESIHRESTDRFFPLPRCLAGPDLIFSCARESLSLVLGREAAFRPRPSASLPPTQTRRARSTDAAASYRSRQFLCASLQFSVLASRLLEISLVPNAKISSFGILFALASQNLAPKTLHKTKKAASSVEGRGRRFKTSAVCGYFFKSSARVSPARPPYKGSGR